MNETKYIIYKITNLINKKIYIGAHKCKDINDDYMGSGKHLKYAQNKYGIENFEKEILEVYNNSEEMFNMEASLVNEEFISRDDVYNIKIGGYVGWDYINENELNGSLAGNEAFINLYPKGYWHGKTRTEETKNKISLASSGKNNAFSGKSHSEETKNMMKETHEQNKHQQGEKNSQFGKIPIFSKIEKITKKIKKEDFEYWEALGWKKGIYSELLICPHCQKQSYSIANMKRWHFDKCKKLIKN